MPKREMYLRIGLFGIALLVILSGCMEGEPTEEAKEEAGLGAKGVAEYSGSWSGSGYSGTWHFTANYDTGKVTGSFTGDAAGDISGTVSEGVISASGTAMGGTVSWSGDISAGGSTVSGTWEIGAPMSISGTWEGSKTGAAEEAGGEEAEGEEPTTEEEAQTVQWSPYNFQEGEHYKYSFVSEDQSGTFYWDVNSVSGDQVTVETGIDLEGGESTTLTMTGNKETVYQQGMMSPIGPFLSMGLYGPWVGWFSQGTLGLGNKWSVTTPEGTFSFEVTGKETYAGQESYVGVAKVNGQVVYKSAIAKDLAFPTYVVIHDSDTGEKEFEMTLQEYTG